MVRNHLGFLFLLASILGAAGCSGCAKKACPTGLFPCHGACIPPSGVCCDDGSYCQQPQACVPSDGGFACTHGASNFACAAGNRHCGLDCIAESAKCCVGQDCTEASDGDASQSICPAKAGFILCGQCVGDGDSCQGICRYCSDKSFCGGDICGDVKCCNGSNCATDTPADCAGSSGSGQCAVQEQLDSCPDGTQLCCSENQVCCRDSANNGAVGCEFQGFCE